MRVPLVDGVNLHQAPAGGEMEVGEVDGHKLLLRHQIQRLASLVHGELGDAPRVLLLLLLPPLLLLPLPRQDRTLELETVLGGINHRALGNKHQTLDVPTTLQRMLRPPPQPELAPVLETALGDNLRRIKPLGHKQQPVVDGRKKSMMMKTSMKTRSMRKKSSGGNTALTVVAIKPLAGELNHILVKRRAGAGRDIIRTPR